jgi:hypothetical protein
MFSLFEIAVQRLCGNLINLNEPSVYKRQAKFLNIWAAFSISRRNTLHALIIVNGKNKGEWRRFVLLNLQ